jgi:phenylacetate-coenzyme A ligase PaaK-like adenylate-forming protein
MLGGRPSAGDRTDHGVTGHPLCAEGFGLERIRCQAHVGRDGGGRDALTVRVEADERPGLGNELRRLRDRIGIRVDVEPLPPDSLPRSERRTQRLFDYRQF